MDNSTKQKIATSLVNKKGYTWLLTDPTGHLVEVKNLSKFCKENNLAYSILRKKGQENDGSIIRNGASKGWAVFAVKR